MSQIAYDVLLRIEWPGDALGAARLDGTGVEVRFSQDDCQRQALANVIVARLAADQRRQRLLACRLLGETCITIMDHPASGSR